MEIAYRKLQPEDAGRYRALRLDCLKRFPEAFGSTYDEEAMLPKLRFEALIEECASDSFMVGAFSDGILIGIAGFRRAERRKARHRGEIVQMYVDPIYRGQRIGESLLRMVIAMAFTLKGIEQVELGVVSNNVSAIALYEKIGFQICGIQKNYFKEGTKYWNQQFMQFSREMYLGKPARQ